MAELKVDREVHDGVLVLCVIGELDFGNVAAAAAELELAQADAPTVLVDLSRLSFMDSSGVRVLLQADARAQELDRRLAVLADTGLPLRVLSTLGLTDYLTVITRREELLELAGFPRPDLG